MDDDMEAPAPVQVEVTLTVDGDWKSDPLKLLDGLGHGTRSLERWQRKAVKAAREQGVTWEAIGSACGISRQAAWERFSTDRDATNSGSEAVARRPAMPR